MSLLPRVVLQPHTHDNGPVLVHGNSRDELTVAEAQHWYRILHEFLHVSRHVRVERRT